MVTGRWDFRIPLRDCPSQNSIMKFHVLVGVLVMVGFAVGKAPVSEVRTCHLCLLEDPSTGCISGSEKCTISSSSPCMVITIYYELNPRHGGRAEAELNRAGSPEVGQSGGTSAFLSLHHYQKRETSSTVCTPIYLGGTPGDLRLERPMVGEGAKQGQEAAERWEERRVKPPNREDLKGKLREFWRGDLGEGLSGKRGVGCQLGGR
ncbi:lymphocyte antigen 6 complex locus protein G5b isoform X2 [Panthera leo]|uniref:lymphocyte antigen 6 complex locus protein G5b isoform X2 n=1 Tax=Panthera leo TaxID=9689 RepID=UPI001C6999BF|nr:lymphocyte antigen 6 complex locus protein G5b isoform X2 [Panthera leo]